eukprot:322328-Prorocentrum_minimum.AAC.1
MEELESGMEKMKLGLPRPPLEASDDKRHLSFVEAGRAVLITAAAPLVPDVLQAAPRVSGSGSGASERESGRGGEIEAERSVGSYSSGASRRFETNAAEKASRNDAWRRGRLFVSVAPRGNRTSRVATVPLDRDRVADMKTLADYVDLLALSLAGRATEEVVYGKMGVSSRAATVATFL